jgi:hypothetical protein
MTHPITAFFVALAAFVYHDYMDPWSVSADVYDIWAMREASLAFDAWEHSVRGLHPDACVCLYCRNRPPLGEEEREEADGQEWEPSSEEEVDFPAEIDLDDADCPLCWWNLPHSDAAHAQALLRI